MPRNPGVSNVRATASRPNSAACAAIDASWAAAWAVGDAWLAWSSSLNPSHRTSDTIEHTFESFNSGMVRLVLGDGQVKNLPTGDSKEQSRLIGRGQDGGGGGDKVALPMDEQRILEEMERMLAADDPRLAARLSGVGQVLRTRRAKAVLSLLMVCVIAAAASVIYLMSVFRPGGTTQNTPHGVHSALPAKTAPAQLWMPTAQTASCDVVVVKIARAACIAWSAASR